MRGPATMVAYGRGRCGELLQHGDQVGQRPEGGSSKPGSISCLRCGRKAKPGARLGQGLWYRSRTMVVREDGTTNELTRFLLVGQVRLRNWPCPRTRSPGA